ncbi:hypothetical protein ACFWMJ_23470 [Streptomyces hawaiiensis]|uniref:DUF7169 domain-containing protein n=1 Tax=Streptomyces hawaiiensis TaxID=67305 RepID=UPI00364FCE7C
MTYSPDHAKQANRMVELLDIIDQAAVEVRQFISAYGDAVTMPGRRPDVDADGTGRQATHGPSRPTEATALDEPRQALQAELNSGARWLAYAAAAVSGVSASMDRALSRWEGEDASLPHPGGAEVDHHNGAARH